MRLPIAIGLTLAALALQLACGEKPSRPEPPELEPKDSRAPGPDAAAPGLDAGADASEPPDAGAALDAAEPPDAATPGDAGADAGDAPDADSFWTKVATDGGADAAWPACFGTAWPLEGETHFPEGQRVVYRHNPPSSGDHWGCWAVWTTASRVVPRERFVHNLEHGGVVLLYRCPEPDGGFPADAFADGGSPCPAEAAAVQGFLASAPAAPAGDQRYVVSAISDMPKRYAAVAWGFTLEADTLDPAQFACFAVGHLGQAPEDFGGNPDPTGCPQSYPP